MEKEKNFVLGKKVGYESIYNPDLLVFVPREEKRIDIGYNGNNVDFQGFDLWNAYEISYLFPSGKPVVKIGTLTYSSETENIVESKSLKLYLNSFNMTKISSDKELVEIIKKDLKAGLNDNNLEFRLFDIMENHKIIDETNYKYFNIDSLPINIDKYKVDKKLLKTINIAQEPVKEQCIRLSSNLLKSNCLVTHQPDWGSVYIQYVPDKEILDNVSLLRYIVSFREHNEFHEQCIERIFHDLNEKLKPKALEVFGKYVRRGGIDINPYRINDPENLIRLRNFRNKLEETKFNRDSRQ